MLKNYSFTLEYKDNGIVKTACGLDNEIYSINIDENDNTLKAKIFPKKKIEMINAYLDCNYDFKKDDKVYVNGYQSWTTSREYDINDIQPGLTATAKIPLVRKFVALFGDYNFQTYTKQPGVFHSYSYTYIKNGDNFALLGSLTERTGYTIFHFNMNTNKLRIQKDVEGVTISSEYAIFDLYTTNGNYNEIFDDYFTVLNIAKPKIQHMAGYTSWYNYYGGITEDILVRDMDSLSKLGDKVDIFQIDDGYQAATGEWLSIKEDLYPHGMKYLVDRIHGYGYKAGLWLAPFNVQKSSKIVKQHPDWLVREPKTGKLELGGIGWGGAYTFNIEIKEVRDYIKSFFNGILNDWGFDMVKLDFLYSICQSPRNNKSRGQLMSEGMDFLRECVGDKILLGCGVPLFPAFGKADCCRISSDVGACFADAWFAKFTAQEIPSTRNAMNNSIFRRHLDGRAFVNDPDVFYVRNSDLVGIDPLISKKGRLGFNDEQKTILATVNNMCGNVLFVSDDVGGYNEKQKALALNSFKVTDKVVTDANYIAKDKIAIDYEQNGEKFVLEFNIHTGENKTQKR